MLLWLVSGHGHLSARDEASSLDVRAPHCDLLLCTFLDVLTPNNFALMSSLSVRSVRYCPETPECISSGFVGVKQ